MELNGLETEIRLQQLQPEKGRDFFLSKSGFDKIKKQRKSHEVEENFKRNLVNVNK